MERRRSARTALSSNYDFTRDEKIGDILANDDVFVADRNRVLLGD